MLDAMLNLASLTRFATPEDLVLQLKTLPPSPKVLLRLQQMVGRDTTSVADLVAVIRLERALAARIVRTANSPVYTLGTPCATIEESVQRLGFGEVHRLALLVAGSEALSQPLPAYGVDPREIWRETVACAVAAEHIARLVGGDEQLAYTTGLMHSVGMLVINAWAQTIAPGTVLAWQDATEEWTHAERELLGYDQADAGAALLRSWDFSAPVIEAVRCQYAPQCASQPRQLACILAAARWLRALIGAPAGAAIAPPNKMMLLALKVNEAQLRECAPEVEQLVQRARQMLGAAG
jgi:HD-like signal output (HDOD) protein